MCYTIPDGGRLMLYDIHPESPVPIYEQIVAQVIFAIASGAVEAGELPCQAGCGGKRTAKRVPPRSPSPAVTVARTRPTCLPNRFFDGQLVQNSPVYGYPYTPFIHLNQQLTIFLMFGRGGAK